MVCFSPVSDSSSQKAPIVHVEVDQSGKIGKTNEDTVLAFSNGLTYAVLIPRSVKQRCLRELRRRGYQPNTIYLRLFAIGLYFLLREHMARIDLAVIDVEYPGHEAQIRRFLLNLLRREQGGIRKEQIGFTYVGKTSPAHDVAIDIFRGVRKADRVLTEEEILRQF